MTDEPQTEPEVLPPPEPHAEKGPNPEPEVVEEEDGPMVSEPLKLVRIASMTQAMLLEVRGIELDENAVARLKDVHARTVTSLRDIMSDELKEELDQVVLPLGDPATEAEVRVAQAQLAGWLEGLFHGIRASLWGQQVAVQRAAAQNIQALQALEAKEQAANNQQEGSSGMYL